MDAQHAGEQLASVDCIEGAVLPVYLLDNQADNINKITGAMIITF